MFVWILAVFGGLAGVLAVMAVIGLFLRADHVVARTAVFPRAPEALYALIREPRWRSEVTREPLPDVDGKRSFRERGRHDTITYVVDEDTPTRIVTRIADDKLPFGGRWIYVLAPEGDGTRLTITEDGFVKNPLFRFLSRTVFSLTATMERYLRDLGAHVGVAVTPTPAAPSPR